MSARTKKRPKGGGVSPAAWKRETQAFAELLKHKPPKPRLSRWVNESSARKELFGLTVLGVIRWPKELGRPGTPTLAEGFVGVHQWWFSEWHFGLGGEVIETEGWANSDPPQFWDAPEEANHYRVYYSFPERANPNWIEIRFSGVRWIETGSAHLPYAWSLTPRGFIFTGDGGLTVLPPITVERRLILTNRI